MPTPSIGRIVHYALSAADVEAVTRRRDDYRNVGPEWPAGAQAHVGNQPSAGVLVPMIITAVFPNEYPDGPGVNGQALLDGNDSLWVTSAREGSSHGQWSWPGLT